MLKNELPLPKVKLKEQVYKIFMSKQAENKKNNINLKKTI